MQLTLRDSHPHKSVPVSVIPSGKFLIVSRSPLCSRRTYLSYFNAKQVVCVPGVWRIIHNVRRAGETRALSAHVREAAPLHRVQLRVGGTEQAASTHPLAYRRASVPVSPLPVRQPRHLQTQETSSRPHGRETVRVRYLQSAIHSEQQSQGGCFHQSDSRKVKKY